MSRRHHQEDRRQYVKGVGRYAWMRGRDLVYVQVTHELPSRPRSLVGEVYRALVSRGYAGSSPELGASWRALFGPLSDAVPRRRHRRAVS